MDYLEAKIKAELSKAFQACFEHDLPADQISLQPTRKEFEGSHTFVIFPYLKISRKKPEETGNQIGEYLKEHSSIVERFNVVKGFLNLKLTDKLFVSTFRKIFEEEQYGQQPSNGKKVIIEFSSPNTNKPLHLGHL